MSMSTISTLIERFPFASNDSGHCHSCTNRQFFSKLCLFFILVQCLISDCFGRFTTFFTTFYIVDWSMFNVRYKLVLKFNPLLTKNICRISGECYETFADLAFICRFPFWKLEFSLISISKYGICITMIRHFQQKEMLKLSSDNAVLGKLLTEIG